MGYAENSSASVVLPFFGRAIAEIGRMSNSGDGARISPSGATMLTAQRPQPGDRLTGLGKIKIRTQTEDGPALLDELLDGVDELLDLGEAL